MKKLNNKSFNSNFLLEYFKTLKEEIQRFGFKHLFFKFIFYAFSSYRIKGNFLSLKETLEYIKKTNKSVIRLGDGEILLLKGKSMMWQKYSESLYQDILRLITNYNEDSPYLLCIPNHRIQATNKELREYKNVRMWLPFKIFFMTIFPKNVTYGNAMLFRFLGYLSIEVSDIFKDKNIIYVANEQNLNIVNLMTSKEFVTIIPKTQKNSYSEKTDLLNRINEKMVKFEKSEVIIFLSCGPLAKILTYELSFTGYRVIDIGYFFEMYQTYKDGKLRSQENPP